MFKNVETAKKKARSNLEKVLMEHDSELKLTALLKGITTGQMISVQECTLKSVLEHIAMLHGRKVD